MCMCVTTDTLEVIGDLPYFSLGMWAQLVVLRCIYNIYLRMCISAHVVSHHVFSRAKFVLD